MNMFVFVCSGLWIIFGLWREIESSPISLQSKGYEGIVVGISEEVGSENCRILLDNLETALTSASKALYTSLEGRASFGEILIDLPSHWPDICSGGVPIGSSRGETVDFVIGETHPVHRDELWTQQSRGCGEKGDFIYVSEKLLLDIRPLGVPLMKEWAKYRYGIFDEIGYRDDPVYPRCYHGIEDKPRVTGCSDKPIENVCVSGDVGGEFNASDLVHHEATRSVLFAATDKISKFCDEKTHDAFAPTKQNLICKRKSAMEVILSHQDFANRHLEINQDGSANTTPTFKYIRRKLTRYVLVVENTKDMLLRESWSFLRAAIRKWTVHDLPVNTEVGFVLANETSAVRVLDLRSLNGVSARDQIASQVPFTPGDSRGPACLSCGIGEAFEMLEERKRRNGPASSVILVVAPGMEKSSEIDDLVERTTRTNVRIVTINYPGVLRSEPLDVLATATGGTSFTVNEKKYNLQISYLTTYFDLTNSFFAITSTYFEGDPDSLPIEIHRRELTDDGRTSITGSFVLEESLGEPAEFIIYTHNIENPLLGNIQLVSPSQKVYTGRTDSLLQFKLMKVVTNINETGTWTYTIERHRNPQPHFVQVMASPKSPTAPVVRARLWSNLDKYSNTYFLDRSRREVGKGLEGFGDRIDDTNSRTSLTNSVDRRSFDAEAFDMSPESSTKMSENFAEYENDENSKIIESRGLPAYKITVDDLKRNQPNSQSKTVFVRKMEPVVLYVEVKRGSWPILGARVEVTVTKRTENDTVRYRERFELLDSGSGDPDLMKGDGIYSKYWSPASGGPGSYTVEVVVSDNGNTAYSWNEGIFIPRNDRSCCGSIMSPPSVRPLSPFRRVLPPLTLSFTKEDVENIRQTSVGRVADLKVEHVPSELKARLIWTAPDMGGTDVSRYEVRFSPTLEILLSNPLSTSVWSQGTPFPLSAGSETSFTLDFSQNRNMLDQPLYFAIISYNGNSENSVPGPLGNHVRVYIPSPPPPPPPSPTDYTARYPYRPSYTDTDDGSVIPRVAQADFPLELILPVVGGLLLLFICLGIYCYFCIVRRKHAGTNKGKQSPTSSPEKNKQAAINIISSPTSLNLDDRTRSTSSTTSSSTSRSTLQQDNGTDLRCDPMSSPYQANDKYGYLSDANRYREQYEGSESGRRYSMLQTPEDAYAIARSRNFSQPRPPSEVNVPIYDRRPPGYVASQISNGTTGRIRTLSPFQSWTASQLLHEHERRTSPYGDKLEPNERLDEVNRHDGPQFQLPPPVPPLPAGVYEEETAYDHQRIYGENVRGYVPGPDYAGYLRTAINPSLRGSLTSVNSGDVRKKRNVTMV